MLNKITKLMTIAIALTAIAGFAGYARLSSGKTAESNSKTRSQKSEICGTVFDWNKKPVKNAFIMLKENPYICGLSGADGEFCIKAKKLPVNKTLLISAAGSKQTVIPIKNNKKLIIKLKKQSPDISKIEIGCNQANFRERWRWRDQHRLTKKQEVCVKAYKNFINSKKAKTIRNKILAKQPLNKSEKPYRYIVLADIAVKAYQSKRSKDKTQPGKNCLNYCKDILVDRAGKTSGNITLEKGYRGKPLTKNDLRILREMTVINCFMGAGRKIKPVSLRDRLFDEKSNVGSVGHQAKNVRLLKLAAALKSPKYSDYSDLNATEFLRPEALRHHFQVFNCWKEDKDGSIAVTEIEERPLDTDYSESDYIYLSDYKGKKPVVIAQSVLEDETCPQSMAAFASHLQRAYGDKIAVINLAEVSTYHGDMWVDEFLYYGRNPNARPFDGIDSPAMQHEDTPERLARITKLLQMKRPLLTGSLVMQDAGWISRAMIDSDAGRRIVLFDINGKRAGWQVGFGLPERTGANSQNSSSWHTPYYGMNMLEQILRNILANGGKYDPKFLEMDSFVVPPRGRLPGPGQWSGFALNVKSVDLTNSEITVETGQFQGSHQIEPPEKHELTFTVDKDTRIIIKEKEKNFNGKNDPKWLNNYKHGTLKDIAPGDLICVDFLLNPRPKIDKDKLLNVKESFFENQKLLKEFESKVFPRLNPADYVGKKNKALKIWNFHNGHSERKVHGQIVFWGEITDKNSDNKTIEVKMTKPDDDDLIGYHFWNEAGEKTDPKRDLNPGKYGTNDKLAAARRYVEGTEKERNRIFRIDASVRILRNGELEQSYNDLQVGDKVSVFYLPFYEANDKTKTPIYPEVILASEFIE